MSDTHDKISDRIASVERAIQRAATYGSVVHICEALVDICRILDSLNVAIEDSKAGDAE